MFTTFQDSIVVFIVVSSLLILLLISFIAFIVSRYQQKQVLYFRHFENLEKAYKLKLLQTQNEIQEATFKYISRELHDNVGQKISLAILQLNNLPILVDTDEELQVNTAVEILSDVLTEFRDLGQSMSNRFMLENDLIFVIKKELERVNRSKMYKISFILDGDYEFLDKDVELIVFRVFQESLHNIIKHAKADSIRVHIKYDPEEMIIEIEDNGVGFDIGKKSEGSGLKNMNDRLEMIHAHLLIQTSFSTGTTLIIKIPTNGRKKSIQNHIR